MSHRGISNKHNLHYTSGRLTRDQITAAFTQFIDDMNTVYPGRFDHVKFIISHIDKCNGGYLWVSSPEIYYAFIGQDINGGSRMERVIDPNWVPDDSWANEEPSMITKPLGPYFVPAADLTLRQTLDWFKDDYAKKRTPLYEAFIGSEHKRMLLQDEKDEDELEAEMDQYDISEQLYEQLRILDYYYTLDSRAIHARLDQDFGNPTIAESEADRSGDIMCAVKKVRQVLEVTPSHVNSRTQHTTTIYSRGAPKWVTEAMIFEQFNMILETPTELHILPSGQKVKSPWIQRRELHDQVVFRVQFLGKHPSRDASFALQIRTVTTVCWNNESAVVLFDTEGTKSEKNWGRAVAPTISPTLRPTTPRVVPSTPRVVPSTPRDNRTRSSRGGFRR